MKQFYYFPSFRLSFQKESALKRKNLLLEEQILSLKRGLHLEELCPQEKQTGSRVIPVCKTDGK